MAPKAKSVSNRPYKIVATTYVVGTAGVKVKGAVPGLWEYFYHSKLVTLKRPARLGADERRRNCGNRSLGIAHLFFSWGEISHVSSIRQFSYTGSPAILYKAENVPAEGFGHVGGTSDGIE
jgi:hypothetical protein